MLERYRLIDATLFEALVRTRPAASAEIVRVAALFEITLSASPPSQEAAAPPRARVAPPLVGADARTEHIAAELIELRKRRDLARSRGLPIAQLEAAIRDKARALRAGPAVAVGDTLAEGRYLVLEKLGAGGFSTVWRAWDEERLREVALKVLRGELARDTSRVERFRRGARLMNRLRHPHIARVYDEAREDGPHHFVVMELLPGGDLHDRVLAGTFDRRRALEAVLGAADGLAFAHADGVVHRDIKPHNILLDEAGGAKLTDFDLGRAEDGTRDTATSASMGTLLYAAPEAMSNAREVGPAGDIYSLAVTAAFCLYGAELPADEIMYERARFFDELPCSEALRAVIGRGVARKPEHRYPTAAAFAEALKAAMAGSLEREVVAPGVVSPPVVATPPKPALRPPVAAGPVAVAPAPVAPAPLPKVELRPPVAAPPAEPSVEAQPQITPDSAPIALPQAAPLARPRARWKSIVAITLGLFTLLVVVLCGGFLSHMGSLSASRKEILANVDGLKTAELAYDSAFDSFVTADWAPSATPRQDPVDWVGNAAFDQLGWRPDGQVRAVYSVELTNGNRDFVVHARSDLDGDGVFAEYAATKTTDAHLTEAPDVY